MYKELDQARFPIICELLKQKAAIPGDYVAKCLLNDKGQITAPKFNFLMLEIKELAKHYKPEYNKSPIKI